MTSPSIDATSASAGGEERFFARVEAIDEIDGQSTLVLDVVRSDSGPFSGRRLVDVSREAADYWAKAFRGRLAADDFLAGFETYIVVLQTSPSDQIWQLERWLTLTARRLATAGDGVAVPALVGEFVRPEKPSEDDVEDLRSLTPPSLVSAAQGALLDRIFDMSDWPSATAAEIAAAFDWRALSQVVSIDVGQGSALALVDSSGHPRVYFDVGAGFGPNKRTVPVGLSFCTCRRPVVVLSHWDTDHLHGARYEPNLLKSRWVVPRQMIGPTHARLANSIFRAGGKVLVFDIQRTEVALSPRAWWARAGHATQTLVLERCTGRTRNDSGLSVMVWDLLRERTWLLVGDAAYRYLPSAPSLQGLCVLSASHHGAALGVGDAPPAAPAIGYLRLLYSFGFENAYDHPRDVAVQSHEKAGWRHAGAWPQGVDVLATTTPSAPQQRNAVAAGWLRRPNLPRHLVSCQQLAPLR